MKCVRKMRNICLYSEWEETFSSHRSHLLALRELE